MSVSVQVPDEVQPHNADSPKARQPWWVLGMAVAVAAAAVVGAHNPWNLTWVAKTLDHPALASAATAALLVVAAVRARGRWAWLWWCLAALTVVAALGWIWLLGWAHVQYGSVVAEANSPSGAVAATVRSGSPAMSEWFWRLRLESERGLASRSTEVIVPAMAEDRRQPPQLAFQDESQVLITNDDCRVVVTFSADGLRVRSVELLEGDERCGYGS
ncbi:MAG: hypothetical protein GY946_24680 [bacterium]|nr:hypothetical protein [bacterium]